VVPRDGIEPPTRGFSSRGSVIARKLETRSFQDSRRFFPVEQGYPCANTPSVFIELGTQALNWDAISRRVFLSFLTISRQPPVVYSRPSGLCEVASLANLGPRRCRIYRVIPSPANDSRLASSPSEVMNGEISPWKPSSKKSNGRAAKIQMSRLS
jgi:hypothetical protein